MRKQRNMPQMKKQKKSPEKELKKKKKNGGKQATRYIIQNNDSMNLVRTSKP